MRLIRRLAPARGHTLLPFLGLILLAYSVLGWGGNVKGVPNPKNYWQVDDVRAGMKGEGRTVIKGIKIEKFQAEVLGVLRNTSPGRDMILCRLSGLDLDKTGVIAGHERQPSLHPRQAARSRGLRLALWQGTARRRHAVSCRWNATSPPMKSETWPRRASRNASAWPSRSPSTARCIDTVTVSSGFSDPQPAAGDGLWMVPLRTPLAASGHEPEQPDPAAAKSSASSAWCRCRAGAVSGNISEEERNVPLQPGGALTVSLITGDFDLSAIGTVTHIEGKRVYGWGHPFFGAGRLRVSAHDRLRAHHLLAPEHQLQDGLAAAGRGHHQRRRQHLHRRLARPPRRHAAGRP